MTQPTETPRTPADRLRERLEWARGGIARQRAREGRLIFVRLALFTLGLLTFGIAAAGAPIALAALPVEIALFILTTWQFDRLPRRRERLERTADHLQHRLRRIEGNWIGSGPAGLRHAPDRHPFAADLDLFGQGSLFELISTTRTAAGAETLARWLCEPAPPEAIAARQAAVAELASRWELREALATADTGPARQRRITREPPVAGIAELLAWAAAPGPAIPPAACAALAATSAAALVSFGLLLVSSAGPWPFAVALAVQSVVVRPFARSAKPSLHAAERAIRALAGYAEILERIEREEFASVRLRELRALLTGPAGGASARLRRLASLLRWEQDGHENLAFYPLARLLNLSTQLAAAIERWRLREAAQLPRWLEVVGEIEALAALGGHASEHPDDVFPEIADGVPSLEAEHLGHPLLPESVCVRNSVALGGAAPHLLIVSGSNMSGKSTFLRAIGLNTALALAGAPVRAARMRLSPLAPHASIVVRDSLHEGVSRFFREIDRMREIDAAARDGRPVLFLIDEILQGTNSHDRAIATRAVLEKWVRGGAIGLITTHDLALTQIADALGDAAANAHFEDRPEDGKLTFDYRLRPGVISRGNALALMRSVGLDV